MAEVIGTISAVISLVEGTAAAIRTIKKIRDLPKAFIEVEKKLPLVKAILNQTRNELDNSRAIEPNIKKALKKIIKECLENADKLHDIIEDLTEKCKIHEGETDVLWKTAKEVYKKILQGIKGHRVEILMKDLMKNLQLLVDTETLRYAKFHTQALEHIKLAIEDLDLVARQSPSLEDNDFDAKSTVNTMNIHEQGRGWQNNPSGGSNQFFQGDHATHHHEYNTLALPDTPPQPFAIIPFISDPDFVERGDILNWIDQRCSQPAGRVALVGFGGVGKSQLAIEYAHRVAEKYTDRWVFWVHAGTQARVEQGFRRIADAINLPGRQQPKADILELVHNWLSIERNGKWLIILDSSDDIDVFYGARGAQDSQPLASYLPQSQNGTVLITSRDKSVARRLTGDGRNIIEVGPMVQDEAVLLLEKRLGPLSDQRIAAELVQALYHVPLAISQAAGYIQARAPRTSLAQYLTEFREGDRRRTKLLGHDSGELRRDGSASNAIFTTWQISFDYIRTKRPSAADLLSLMSFFDRQGIPESLLKPSKEAKDEAEDQSANGWGVSSSNSSNDDTDEAFDDDVAILRDFCLIAVSEEEDAFEMHRLVQLSTRKWLEANGDQEKFKQQFVIQMADAFPTEEHRNWPTCQKLFAHVEVASYCKPAEDELEKVWATLLHNGGRFAWVQGRYNVAERMIQKSERSRRRIVGNDDIMTLVSRSLLACIFRDQGRWGEAEKLNVQVMESSKEKLQADHFLTLTSMSNLASTYREQGRWKEAEKLEMQVMEIQKTQLGADHLNTLTSMANLALTLWHQGRWEEAEKLQVQVMKIREEKLGADHLNTLTVMASLASTFWKQGRWKEAEKLKVQVMEIHKEKLGPDHPNTLISTGNLALTYRGQGRLKEAEKLELQVIEISKEKLGANHPFTLTSRGNLASIYREQGRWEEAEKLEVQVMEIRKGKFGADHPDTLLSMNNLASILWKQGRWEEAEKLFIQVIEIQKEKLGANHPFTLTSRGNLASTYREQGRWEEAEKLEVQVMEIQKTQLGADHPDTLISMANLASGYRNQGRWKEAEKLEVQVIEIRKEKLGAEHPDTLTSMNNLAYTWHGQGRNTDALVLMRNCAQVRQRVLGKQHPNTLSSLATAATWGG